MANPTTNYGWPMPTSTDLVTDLPADFALFGQPVDTTLKALNPETTLGDIAYRSATSNTNTRLGIGTAGQVLAVSGGVPAWTTTADVTPLTTKGDLFTFTTVDARIGVGANNTVLTADSAEASGLKWATPSAGAMVLIKAATTFTNVAGTSTTFDNVFSSTYKTYCIVIQNIFSAGGTYSDDLEIQLRYGGVTQAALYWSAAQDINKATTVTVYANSAASVMTIAQDIGDGVQAGIQGQFWVDTFQTYPTITGMAVEQSGNEGYLTFGGSTTQSRTYDGFLLKSSSTNVTGTVAVYGLVNS